MADPSRSPNHRIWGRTVFKAGQRLSVHRASVRGAISSHDHDFLEIVLVESGRGMHSTLYGSQPVRRGDLIVIRPWSWHAYSEPVELVVWNCCLSPMLLRHPMAGVGGEVGLHGLLGVSGHVGQRRGAILKHLGRAWCARAVGQLESIAKAAKGSLELAGHLLLFLDQVVKAIGPDAHSPDEQAPAHPAVLKAASLIESRLTRPWSLAELSQAAGLDRSYLARLFKRQIGIGPIEYLIHLRCERAAELILTTSLPVGEIGRRVGWDDPNYFARRFGSHFGHSPSAYRSMMKP